MYVRMPPIIYVEGALKSKRSDQKVRRRGLKWKSITALRSIKISDYVCRYHNASSVYGYILFLPLFSTPTTPTPYKRGLSWGTYYPKINPNNTPIDTHWRISLKFF